MHANNLKIGTREVSKTPKQTRPNSGTLSKNTRKAKPTHADYVGSIDVDGRQYYVDAWVKDSKSGGKFLSLSLKPKQDKAAEPDMPF